MLAVIEQTLLALRQARNDADVIGVLADVARQHGFRSAFLLEYPYDHVPERVLDTDPARAAWWPIYLASDLRVDARKVIEADVPFVRVRENSYGAFDAVKAEFSSHDMLETTVIRVVLDGELVGLVGFSGDVELAEQARTGLQLIAYMIFAEIRTRRVPPSAGVTLTPREQQVIRLSAEGLTSAEIANELGMSARTANQHVDNVAAKLGTRNRAHTVAEAIRNNLLS
jgi:LuxR family transcriptional regulator, quorum-sensing system regulator BjaR1